MLIQMKWENVYKLWQNGCYFFPKTLTTPVSTETVFVKYDQEGYIYGYDWLENEEAQYRKQLIKKSPMEFLCFTKPSNKGTIQTAEMLSKARSEEELAAIWIAATAKELSEYNTGNGIVRYTDMLHIAACEFLRSQHIFLWHHAMKKLVPSIMIPSHILNNIVYKDSATVMSLIQMNTLLLKSAWMILIYSSLNEKNS